MAAKSYAKTDSRAREEEHVNFGVTDYPLTVMTLLFLTSNSSASHRLRSKVLEFLEMLDPRDYAANQDVNWRLALARAVGAAVMRGGAKVLAAVEHRVLEDMEWADWHEQFFAAYKTSSGHVAEGAIIENELSDADVQYVDEYVSTRLRYAYLWTARTFLRDVADRIDAVDLGEISRFNDEVMERMERIVQRGRQARALLATEGQDFSTGDVSFEAALRATWEARNKPQSVVRSGLRLLNDMLGGGYEGGRVYVYFALSGGGKSGVLAMSALWACDQRFNPEFRTKDPTKTPCVVYLSQENDLYETIERMISFALGSDVDLRHVEQEDLVRTMEAALQVPPEPQHQHCRHGGHDPRRVHARERGRHVRAGLHQADPSGGELSGPAPFGAWGHCGRIWHHCQKTRDSGHHRDAAEPGRVCQSRGCLEERQDGRRQGARG
jgi:hypothetical protein